MRRYPGDAVDLGDKTQGTRQLVVIGSDDEIGVSSIGKKQLEGYRAQAVQLLDALGHRSDQRLQSVIDVRATFSARLLLLKIEGGGGARIVGRHQQYGGHAARGSGFGCRAEIVEMGR